MPSSRPVRVWPGDKVGVQAQLGSSPLGRLYVFARETREAQFSPYVLQTDHALARGEPHLLSPMALRLVRERPVQELRFTADIDGFLQVMQEVDEPRDPRAHVRISRESSADVPWLERVRRWMVGCLTPIRM